MTIKSFASNRRAVIKIHESVVSIYVIPNIIKFGPYNASVIMDLLIVCVNVVIKTLSAQINFTQNANVILNMHFNVIYPIVKYRYVTEA